MANCFLVISDILSRMFIWFSSFGVGVTFKWYLFHIFPSSLTLNITKINDSDYYKKMSFNLDYRKPAHGVVFGGKRN